MSKSVLFVCMGNICRSPAGEAVLKYLVDQNNLAEDVQVESAGTVGYHAGHPADARMQATAERRGYKLTSRARQITPRDLTRYDLIIAMDRDNFCDIQRLHDGPLPHVKLLSDYLDDSWPRNVPDPYYGGDDGFETVLDMMEAACPRILAELQSMPTRS